MRHANGSPVESQNKFKRMLIRGGFEGKTDKKIPVKLKQGTDY